MTSAQVVETNNCSSQNYPHPDDHTIRTTDTPGFKPFTKIYEVLYMVIFLIYQQDIENSSNFSFKCL